MTRLRGLASHARVLLIVASFASMASPRAEAAASAAADAPDLRDALRRFYVHELSAELGLTAARASALAPRIDALLDAHRAAARNRVAAGLDMRKALDGTGDPASALAALAQAEDDGRVGISRARAAVLDQLGPREQARFLAFEEPFRARVRALLNGSASGSQRGAAARGSRTGPGIESERTDSLRDTMRLVFVHEVRGELGLDDARTLAILGPIDQLLAARQAGDRERRQSLDRLRSLAADDTATPAALTSLVKAALASDETAASSVSVARRGVLATLSPREGCQFILLEQRLLSQARRQIRDARAQRDRSLGAERPQGRPEPAPSPSPGR